MIRILQGNLNRSRTADQLLTQLTLEHQASAVIISEQYKNKDANGWFADKLNTAAIWIPDTEKLPILDHGSHNGFVWVKCTRFTIVSCYLTPNEGIASFREKVDELEDTLRELDKDVIVAGDFNAKSPAWGSSRNDSRGKYILEMAARLCLTVQNIGSVSTFRRPGYTETIPDITLATEHLGSLLANWKVIEDYTGSDHQYITMEVRLKSDERKSIKDYKKQKEWNVRKLNKPKLLRELYKAEENLTQTTPRSAGQIIDATMRLLHEACNTSMPCKKSPRNARKAAYWWNDEIAELRKTCLMKRRRAQRAKIKSETSSRSSEHKDAKKHLRQAIKHSKSQCWKSLINDVDRDPWGLGYKIVMKKLKTGTNGSCKSPNTISNIVDALFPTHPKLTPVTKEDVPENAVPLFSIRELEIAAASLKPNKAPGPDGIPAEILKITAQKCPTLLLNMYNACLTEGTFDKRWKVQRLILLDKGKGQPSSPSNYRPLCMLDTAGKLLEKLLQPRLQLAIQLKGGLSGKQYGFRKGKSTTDAVQTVLRYVEETRRGNHHSRKLAVVATLDVRNAFNSVKWEDVLTELKSTFQIPTYLLRIMQDYLRDRILVYDTSEGERRREVTAGAAQGSILGPDIWNIVYDGILKINLPEETHLVAYADDLVAVILARNAEQAQWKLNQVLRRVTGWMSDHGLELAANKTEIVMITRKRIPTIIPMQVVTDEIMTSPAVKYLGITLDTKLTFGQHIKRVTQKATKVTEYLSRLMNNVNGPSPSKRRILMNVAQSIMLYGAEIWAESLLKECYRKHMSTVQRRGALRISCSYRTVSESAALVVAGVIPIELLAQEKRRISMIEQDERTPEVLTQLRDDTLKRWQDSWEGSRTGRWTARLIPHIKPWINRTHGEVSYHLTQFLTGHGHFRKYLHRMDKVDTPECHYCSDKLDDAEHTFFKCKRWTQLRRNLTQKVGNITPETIIDKMIQKRDSWEKIAGYIETVLRTKKNEEATTLRRA